MSQNNEPTGLEIAVVGMAGRFPGAPGVDALWANLRAGVESIRRFTEEELDAAKVPESLRADPAYVPAGGALAEVDLFDAAFFGFTPREAEVTDPQQRLFLEVAWEALEHAGYDAARVPGRVGVYAGTTTSSYHLNLLSRPDVIAAAGGMTVHMGNDRDFLATRASFKMGLEGPAVVVQTACSTSLVATHLACQGLLGGDCEMALVGGASVAAMQHAGYVYQQGDILAPDGHCRAFDAQAGGTVGGSGVAVAVLKRLEDALADGDTVHAVILASAINNDGSAKIGFTAPRVEGQAGAIRAAQVAAEVDPATITYVEAHGTGTQLGDPIEIEALTRAFRAGTDRTGFCAVGSIKTNLGHLDAAAGVAGLIKTTLALRDGEIPPSLHFTRPNPQIDFASSPFFVNTTLAPWTPPVGVPRRAGVSSFGIGGTNAHVVMEEPPAVAPSPAPARPEQLLVLSARTETGLEAAARRLAAHLEQHPEQSLADVAWTLQQGRRGFAHRRAVVARTHAEAARALADPARGVAGRTGSEAPAAVFLFPGQGAQYAGMARGLHAREPVFRAELDRCAELLRPHLGLDLREVIFAADAERLKQTALTQPALFAVEYAIAKQWMAWGITPESMIGHSVGEYVAACLAGVFSLEDALALVAERGRLMQALPPGAMLAVPLPAAEVEPGLGESVSVATINAPDRCVVSGPGEEIARLEAELVGRGIKAKRVETSHAFHSPMMDPILDAFAARVGKTARNAPALRWVSNLTGTWITPEEATDPAYWASHLRQAVRFADCVATLAAEGRERVFIECGPGRTLSSLVRRQVPGSAAIHSIRHADDSTDDVEVLLGALGRAWAAGAGIDWRAVHGGEARRRVPLPTYPFERKRFWIDRAPPRFGSAPPAAAITTADEAETDAAAGDPREGWSATERAVGRIWETLIGAAPGLHDDFFGEGGDSLMATQLVARIRSELRVEMGVRAVFDAPTVAGLAALVGDTAADGREAPPAGAEALGDDEAEALLAAMAALDDRLAKLTPAQRQALELRRARPSGATPAAVPAAIAAPAAISVRGAASAPLSFAQRRLWFLDRMEPGNAFYNLPNAVRLRGALDAAALERALGEIVRRHEALRTVFAEAADGEPVQVIVPFAGYALPVEDLSALGEADRDAAVRRRVDEEAVRPFDLSAGPLFRAALLRLGEEDHVLLLSMHHIVSDGWSIGLLLREQSMLYAAYLEGRESPLSELPVQYADYAAWQHEQLAGGVLDRQLAYWRERLAGAPELLELPTDHPRPPVQTYRAATVPVSVSAELMDRLQALGRSEGATLYMTLLGAFKVLLSKYSGSEDIVVGSPIAGRTMKEVEELIGFFVNTLVLRTDLSGDPSFREVLRRAREVTLGAYAHQDVPFEKLVEELQPERTLSHSPLFQVMFQLDKVGGGSGGGALPGLSARSVGAEQANAQFDLSLELAASPQGLRGTLIYSTDLFERGTVERMLGHLERLLEQFADGPDARLSRVALARAEERAQVVAEWNQTDRPFPREACIHQLFQAQTERTPHAVALAWGPEELTYRELDVRANRLAHHLAGLGVGPESRVGLRIERGVENVVATLAVLKAGGCCIPVDMSYPAERMELMLADSAVRILLSGGEVAAGSHLHVIRLDQVAEVLAAAPDHPPPPSGVSAGNLAYVFYTSGSTGRPKGVMMGHGEVVQFAACLPETMPLGPGDRVAQASNASFDAAVFEIWGALFHGATLVGIDRDVLLSAPLLGQALRDQGITHLYQTAALFNQHVREQVDVYASLRQLVFGAEAVGTESVRRMLRAGRPERVLHEYGPTEATVWCTLEVVEEVAEDAPTVSIGKPIPNARSYVLDPAGEPLPVGVPGELCIGGAGVVRGYLGRPGQTAERFVPDPFAAEPGARMYRTGDRARWKADGKLEFLGRVDDQVKIRGFRIEPGEVETAITAYPGVQQARVMMREDQPGDKRLVAYVVGSAELDGLRAHLRESLPEYMVPQAIVALDLLPLNANGKVDRKALPVPEYADADRYVAPRTPTEEVLAGIWAEVLRLDRVGAEESFFELGGHSLLATRVVSRVRAVFAIELPLRALFEGPTVAELAARVEEMRGAELPMLPPVVPVGRDGALPLSFAQERLWFIDRLEPGNAVYNVPLSWRLGGELDAPALERALGEIIRRHETLRTVFAEVNDAPVQVIAPFDGFALAVEDLSELGEADREAAVRRRAGEEARQGFDLTAGPLFRAVLLRLGAEDHVLLLSMHHILVDEWSLGLLRRELSALYAAYRDGRESPLAELAVQYADYAVWQREQLGGDVLDGHLAYWKERLAGAPELLELPTDRPRPAVQTFRGAQEGITLSGELLARLEALGRGEGATLFMTLLAAFQVLLGRYGGSEDVVVGSPVSGRTRREVEELIGLFLNTLVLRADLSGDPSFREVLGRAREMTLGAFEHQEIPFERLVTELQPGRSLSYSPLFQVMFVLQEAERAAGGAGAAGSLELRGMGAGSSGTSKFDLTLFMVQDPSGLHATLEYNTDLFERGTIRRMLGHLKRVLEDVSADANVRLSELSLLEDAERRQVVAEWNATEAEYPRERCAHELFEAQADRTPDAVAVAFEGGELTYRELDERANRLAWHLTGLGVGPDARVGLCLERGPEMMVGVLAILKAGAAYVPLDPAYPAERLALMLEDSAARVLLTQASLVERLPASDIPVLRLDADVAAIARESAERPRVPVTPDNLAYVIYTSGSTGRPKGVAMPHRPLVNLLAWQEAEGLAPASSVTLQFTSISFDVSFQEIFSTWCTGGTLVLTTEEIRVDPQRLARQLESERVERLFLPFIALQHLAEAAVELGIAPASMREVITAGEQLRITEPIRRWFAQMPECALVNQYGPSETHVVSARVLEGEPADWPLLPSIGAPVANTQLYVLDHRLEPSPIGVPGELLLGGDAVARGYLARPALTAERFVPDPFGAGGRLYRTGDRARWLASGEVEYLGRTDDQVKIRGFRIEPGEVEAALSDHPAVREAVVVVREDVPGDRRLVAYVVAEDEVGSADLRAHVKGRLPEYMVPSAVVVLDALPLTPSGKVARRALPAPDLASAEESYVAPRTPTEEVLAGIWGEVLRLERVGVEESFFELGGHSLLATRVVSRVRQLLGVELPLRALFEGPTVAELAKAVEEERRAEQPVLPPVVPVERTGALPLSFAQERLWFIDRLEPGSTAYNLSGAWRLTGALDEAAMERALGEIVRRHEALRTTFADVDGSPVQVIAPFDGFALPVEDLSELSAADREAAVRRRAGEEVARPFDLAAGPLFRAALLRLGDEDRVLQLSMHHIVSDGWSMGVFSRELWALYAAYRDGRESPLPELAVQYADYAAWQREQLEGEILEGQLAWWRERMAGAPELLELPSDHPRPATQTYRGATVPVALSHELRERLQALARSEGATLYMVLLGAFQVLLGKYAGSEDIVVGSPIAGRTRGEVEELIGCFINTLMLRTDLSGDPSFRETLRRVREATLGAYAHQEVPFEKLVAELQPERSLSHSPLFQVMFTLQNAAGGGGALAGLGVSGVGAELQSAEFDLSLTLMESPEGLRGGLNYSTDLFDRGTIERMIGHLARVLEQAAARPEARLSELELLSAEERGQVLEAWNRTAAEVPADRCIHALFEAQAERTPDAVAVCFKGESLTYAELNARANRLAHHLRGLGVGPDARVGICLERGLEMMVSLLAVLKAGGAYVPLDPGLPAERLAYMLDDSGVPLVLAQEALLGAVPAREGVEVLAVEALAERLTAESTENPRSGVGPDSLAYVIYTSGSTGRPKGVMNVHRGVVNLLWSMRGTVAMAPADRLIAITTLAFDISVLELFLPLLSGARVEILDRAAASDPALLGEAVGAGGGTVLQATPATWRLLLDAGWEGAEGLRALSGGEALPAELAARLRERVGALWNVYGPTETTIWSTAQELDAGSDSGRGHVSIGAPVANTRVYVLDAWLSPVPAGVPGELYIGGMGVARGYLGRPGLSAEKFVPDPFAAEPGARLYRTGDRARWRAEGTLEFLGRNDHQVKVRGFRIELGEIEAVLRRHERVADCAVAVRAEMGETRLVAYVVGDADAEMLRAHVRRSLPEYMVPSAFVFLAALPLTPNGKLDRKALPAPDFAPAEERYVAPRTPTEEVLSGIWAEVLRLERVGAEESFFDLGGHSLLATRVAAHVRKVFGVELPLRAFFERPVLSALAAEIDRLRGSGAAAGADAIVPAAREGDLPVTFAQERMWFVDALDPGSPVYAIPFSYGITGELDEDALRRALAELVRRHEPLRTALPAVDGVPVQRIAPPPADFDLPVADLRHLPEGERRAEAGRLSAEASQHRFDLANGPLFRASLVRVADDEHHLLLNLHHAVGDGWSVGVLLDELSALYGAFSRGEPSPLAEPALQYADYAAWQREQLAGEALERQLAYWKARLDGAPALLELPTDRPRPPVESHRGGVEQMIVSTDVTANVHALARREGATLFMVLLAALDVVLGRLAGQEDVVVGTPIAGRTRAETDRMVGLFLNSLALRTDLSGDPSFRELLARVRETTLDAYAHQELPFERVLEEVRPERSLAHAPVFQVMLNLLNFEDGGFRAEGLEVAGGGTGGALSSKFDLTLYVEERDGRISVALVYAADLFDAPRMRGLLAQLEGVLRQAAAAPETRVGALSLDTEAARGVLPDPARPIEAEAWRGAVHETFAAHAAESPDALAIFDGAETWTYAELDAAANRIAHRLIDGGVRPGDVVAVYAHRSAALVRALLGAWKAGAAFAILDPAYPPARLAAQVRASKPVAILRVTAAGEVPGDVSEALGESVEASIALGAKSEEPDEIARDAITAPVISVGPDDLAYVAFTSGTTGQPKAIAGTHRPLAHFFGWYAKELGIGAADRVSVLSGLAHDPLLRDVFAALAAGGSIAIPDPEQVGTPGWLARWMGDAGITIAHLTPAMAQLVASSADAALPALRLACFGGDVLRAGDVERLRAIAPNAEAVNFYGATETPQAMGFFRLPADLAEVGAAIPVGRGIDGVDLLVLTPSGTLAGIGELGEIAVRTPYLARGYLNDAELTAARFVANPITGDPADRVYRTGDLGRYRPDGAVEPMGRADQQVKVRGFRVELGEVESALTSHPAIREAAVIARETDAGDHALAAYWVPSGEDGPDAAELRAHLKALLPEYTVPSAYVRLERLPLTANGKLDRRALPEPEPAAAAARSASPRTPTEEILAELWAELLRVRSVGVDDDFFALGGHSLLATRLLARMQSVLGVVLPLRALFEGPTVAALAARVEETRRAGLPALPPVVPVDRDRPLPLSFAQERLWFIDRLEPGSATYNVPMASRLDGALDVDALERAVGEIVRRHESLRTTFADVEGTPVQVIAPFGEFTLPVKDLSGLGEADRQAALDRYAREEAERPFDLVAGPLFRAVLLRMGAEEHVLLLSLHHIVSDVWSAGVLFGELSALYAAYREGGESPLPELPVQYADYAVWQREQLAGEVLDRQMAYWKETLAGAPELLELPTDRPRPAVQTYRGATVPVELSLDLLERLEALGRSEGTTLFMTLLGAFQVLLGKYAGNDDVVVGSPIAGRMRGEVEALIGFFVNTLVLRTDLSGDPSFREVLGRVRASTLGAYEHQEMPFEKLVAELQPERSQSHSPLFQVIFTMRDAGGGGDAVPGLQVGTAGVVLEIAKFDLNLTLVATPQGLRGGLNYNIDLFERGTIDRMIGHLERVLEQVAADADVPLSRLELAAGEERRLLLDEWGGSSTAPDPAVRCVHELFAEQAARTPDAVALARGDETLTYAELHRRSDALARRLAARGVGPDVRVGICVERGMEMVVGLLAILKAGGAYVPLDPQYPAERLAYMLADAGATLLLTQERLRDRLPAFEGDVVLLDGETAEDAPGAEPRAASPESLAYVLYTSGSTGQPKGVEVPHRAIVRLVRGQDYISIDPTDVFLQLAPATFDAATLELWGPLLNGARLAIHPAGQPSVESIGQALAEHGVTILWLTAGLFHLVVEERIEILRGVRQLLAGGDVLSVPHVRRVLAELPGTTLINGYGPTENTTFTCCHRIAEAPPEGASIPIGRPIAGTYVRVLDAAMQPAPVGVPGELYAGGAGLALGYLNQPELTAEKFVADPYLPGARLYRTGDRVRWVEVRECESAKVRKSDGDEEADSALALSHPRTFALEFLGRVDTQVKIRGFRIEPGEIEARLAEHPGVRAPLVQVREDAAAGRRLVAYYLADEPLAAAELKSHLSERLPDYMVPAAFVWMEAYPLTPNGKVDRRALPAPADDALPARGYEEPIGPVEEMLAAIWGEVLGAARVGRADDFFELGGHSLLIMRLLARIQATFDLEVSIRTVFSMPTLEAMAGEIERRIYEDVEAMSDAEAEALAESTSIAGV